MAKRPCAGLCGALVLRGYCPRCEAKSPRKAAEQRRLRERDPRVKGWYDSARWKAMRAGHLRNHPLCVGYPSPDVHAAVPEPATDVDHIVPHGGVYELFWNGKRQGLCESCHSRKTAVEDGGFGHRRAGHA